MIYAESGSTKVKASTFDAIAYVHVCENPFNIMKEAYSALRVHLNTFRLLEEKTAPSLVDKFGWCTWDAFYLTVEPTGIWHGVKDFVEGGAPPRFLIIDDGWQSINLDGEKPNEDAKNLVLGGTQMTARLHRLDECEKFRKYKGGSILGPNRPTFDPKRPKMLISKAIELEHAEKDRDKAIQSGVTDLSAFERRMEQLKKELDALFGREDKSGCGNCSCKVENYGMKAFTRDLRTKFKGLDDIYVWHALCGAWGGVRPGSTHLNSKITPCKLSPGLDGTMNDLAVVKIIEGGIGLVHPEQVGDFFDSMHSSLLVLVLQDPNGDPMGVYWLQGVHMIHCAYNSMWMGQIIQPDWDMFQSDHLCAQFHAGSRAICGGPVYVSDSVGCHDFQLLKKLVYPDGTIPKCQHFALPTRDCLFKNPLFDNKTILKIWNFNKYGGVIGAFNCQGAGWDPKERRIKGHSECYKPISGSIHVTDIEWDQKTEAAQMGKAEEYIVYLNQADDLILKTPKSDAIEVTIQPSSFELFSFVPIRKLGADTKFAPIGLTNMFNSGGTIQEFGYIMSAAEISVKVKVKGGGNFLAYSNVSPKKCFLNDAEVAFEWFL
ncbi:hypothetical protein GH714_004679 [Hevea brasiliensis]|uniref:Galactinol--sucrose galactosyltransferase n=1 Tax=Hevea brasiliensis TaxID=3981 RepID=A0A6A6M8Y2_HEVBR|nr:hypothetical protein GH714_004679 [Hevea brasiliensis]